MGVPLHRKSFGLQPAFHQEADFPELPPQIVRFGQQGQDVHGGGGVGLGKGGGINEGRGKV